MNYLQFVNNVLETAKSHKLVYEVGEGDIYEHLNSGDHKYPCVFLTVQNIDYNGSQMTVTGSLFYVDALLSDTSNKLQIQATGITTLQQIFMRLMDNYPDFDLRTGRYTPFDEKFADLCAGVFSNFTVSFMDDICIVNDDIFEGDIPTPPEPTGKYLTITVDSNAGETVINPKITGAVSPNLQYRVNDGDWNDFIFGESSPITVFACDSVHFKGLNPNGICTSVNDYLNFAISDNVHLSGSIMSLIDGIGECDTIPNNYCFCNLFNSAKVKTVSKDFLSATHLKENCYNSLFYWCKSLEVAPSLPAEVLVPSCYNMTFAGCTALENAPEINATTLAEYCFLETFAYCSSLKTTPELNYMNLEQGCYYEMFKQCTSLETAPALPATQLKSVCYYGLFDGCTSLKNTPVLPAMVMKPYCYYRMFRGCTSLVNAPELPATVLSETGGVSGCYESMFENCTSLVTPPALPATVLSNGCYNSMFKGCTSLETTPSLPAESLEYYCYEQMFSGCEKLTQAPVLNSQTLVIHCYYEMFKNCKNLNYVKCLATNIQESSTTETSALTDWLYGVSSTGTFVKKYGVEYLTNSPSGIPQGWTVEEIDAPTPPEPEPKYMTITVDDSVEGEAVIKPTVTGSLPNLNLQYRINNREWNDFIVGTTADIKVVAGDFVQFKGVNESGLSIDTENYLNFDISDSVHLSGNVMSLIDGVGETLVIPNDYCFYRLFSNSNIKTVSSDFLPATEITKGCYQAIFYYCTNLVDAPIVLPAEVLKERCYSGMYSYCTNLVTIQDILPSKTLAKGCYFGMYGDCYNLVTPPQLPATEMCEQCYSEMFYRCSSLSQAPVLNAKQLASFCYSIMFYGCSSLQYPPELPSEEVFNSCYYRMFDWCTSLVRCPELPAKVMQYDCYREMFHYCTSIKNAPILPSTSLYNGCYKSMFEGCENLTEIPELPSIELKPNCYAFMFKNCISLEKVPILPSTTLVDNCYVNMFDGCSKLSYVKSMATEGTINEDGTYTSALTGWLKDVAPTGTFVKPAAAVYVTDSPGGIPSGWTVEEI